ncbi:amino acid permease 1-like [Phragmites australis]|uniref:amino acid permease 1-like n=1 Tax=Phragmites australis TaxID=29695 RepID=UPI002D7779BD|nr:amino acid permease 1-like [Phragmites australis]
MGEGMRVEAMDIDAHPHSGHGDVDDDGKERRTGTVWTATAHIITAVIGSGVLSLAWAMAQLGWVAGPVILLLFAAITYYMCGLLADCYRVDDPVTGKRNYTYTEAVESYLGGWYVWFCGFCQYVNMFGTGIGYTITASVSAAAILKSNCFHWHGHDADCTQNTSSYIMAFGVVQVIFSQLPNFHELWWLSVVAAVMSFSYATIAVGLGLAQTMSGPTGKTTLTGTEVGVDVDSAQKIWMTFQALGNIAFAYSYTIILIEIQDTLRAPPAENKTMRQATIMGVSATTAFYMLCGCLGYSAFGNSAPGNILTGFYEPYWLVDFANVCIVLHLVGGFQVFLQPLFAAVEGAVASRCPSSTREYGGVNVFRLVWRTAFVAVITLAAVLLPFFNSILGILGSVAFWPLTVFFPVEMHIRQRQVPRFSARWVALQSLSFVCFLITIAACASSVQGVFDSLKTYKPFETRS